LKAGQEDGDGRDKVMGDCSRQWDGVDQR